MAEVFQKKANGEWAPLFSKTVCPLPIGCIMPMSGSQNPNTIWPGTTWNKLADGKFLMSDSTGGKAEVNAQIPNHYHKGISNQSMLLGYGSTGAWTGRKGLKDAGGGDDGGPSLRTDEDMGSTVAGLTFGNKVIPTGTIKVCMWERVA